MKDRKEDLVYFLSMVGVTALLRIVFSTGGIVYTGPEKIIIGLIAFAILRIERVRGKVDRLIGSKEEN